MAECVCVCVCVCVYVCMVFVRAACYHGSWVRACTVLVRLGV
jgi:hypothetical protein